MQIDFHHTVTYVCARIAGFTHDEADIIAYSAQYVDEATNEGTIVFENNARYSRMASAHKMLDRRNFSAAANAKVWVPFHFLPGNGGKPAGENPEGSFIEKLVCTEDSYISREMLDMTRADKDKPYALHRLGIAMHVYADTHAHQKFAGVQHRINEVNDLELANEDIDFDERLVTFFKDSITNIKQRFVNDNVPLGHGPALECPDKPYLKWSYTNGMGERIERDNTEIFMNAVTRMIGEMMAFRDPNGENSSAYNEDDINQIRINFETFTQQKGHQRHAKWIESIARGDFNFGPVQLSFIPKGEGSWKYQAIGTTKYKDDFDEKFEYTPEFLSSNYKLFHDALQAHYFDVIHDILPKYGICAS